MRCYDSVVHAMVLCLSVCSVMYHQTNNSVW